MLVAFPRLAVGLQAVTRLVQQPRHRAIADRVTATAQFVRQPSRTLARPTQGRFRVAARQRLHQRFQGGHQRRLGFRPLLAAATRPPQPLRRRLVRMLLTVLQFAQSQLNRVPREPRGASDGGHAAVAEFLGFGRGPLATGPLIQYNFQSLEFATYPFDCSCIVHTSSMAMSAATENPKLTTLFLPAP
jgi:hypothetical protein